MQNVVNAMKTGAMALFFTGAVWMSPAQAGGNGLSIEAQCDAAAGSRDDRTRNTGFAPVENGGIKLGIALSACREAYNAGGNPRIAFQLARALEQGGQLLAAQGLYREAALQGHSAAMVRLGRILQEKGDPGGAFALYRRAAEDGDPGGAYALGLAYRDGIGTPADARRAARWLDTAASGGYEIAALATEPPHEDGATAGAGSR